MSGQASLGILSTRAICTVDGSSLIKGRVMAIGGVALLGQRMRL